MSKKSFDALFEGELKKSFTPKEENTKTVTNQIETPVPVETTKSEVAPSEKKPNVKETVNLNLRLYKSNYIELKHFVEQEGMSLNQAINKAVKEFVKANKEEI